jgi:glycosyltransferase involved in cell wall biosynthesis
MKILFLSYTDFNGGAARATFFLAKGIRDLGHDVQMIVDIKTTDYYWIKSYKKSRIRALKSTLFNFFLSKIKRQGSSYWSINILGNKNLVQMINDEKYDLINIHWIGNNMISLSSLKKLNAPIVWSMYDFWPITGGCHYTAFCKGYISNCSNCPQLKDNSDYVSKVFLLQKASFFSNFRVQLVPPSKSLFNACFESSAMQLTKGNIATIPHGTDLSLFSPVNKREAKKILGLNEYYKYILFGSSGGVQDVRKGFQFLKSALEKLGSTETNIPLKILIFGQSEPASSLNLGIDIIYTGIVKDDLSLKLIYSAADVTITPSMQEAFGMTASESMACGTPVVAFATGGPLDVIDHKVNGYLAQPFDSDDLANGILWVLKESNSSNKISLSARTKCEKEYGLEKISNLYVNLYKKCLNYE